MPTPKQPPRRKQKPKPKPRPKPRKPPKSDAEKEKARKRAALIRRAALLTLFVGLSGIFLYNNRDYFLPALDNYSISDLLPQKDELAERLKAAKKAEADSAKAAKRAAADNAKFAKKAEVDSIRDAKKEAAEVARAVRWAEEDSISAARRKDAERLKAAKQAASDSVRAERGDWIDRLAAKGAEAVSVVKGLKIWEADSAKVVKKAEADSIKAVKRAAADSISAVKKARAEKAKTDKAERKRVESGKIVQKTSAPKEPKELKSVDEILGGGLEFADNAEPDGAHSAAKTEPHWEPSKTELAETVIPEVAVKDTAKVASAQADTTAEAAPYAEAEPAPPKAEPAAPPKPGLVESVKTAVAEKFAALVKLIKPEPAQTAKNADAPPSKPKYPAPAESEQLTMKDTLANTGQIPPEKSESVKTAKAEVVTLPTGAEQIPPESSESVKAAKAEVVTPPSGAEQVPPAKSESVKTAEAEPAPPPEEPADTFHLSNIPCKLADRDDLTIYLTAELIFNGEPIRQEIIFKRGALTAVAGSVVRGHGYGNVSTARISKDLLTAFNGVLLAGDLNRVDVRDFRVEPNPNQ